MARKFTATYLPYTFDELMKPVIMYNKAYEEVEKQLDDLEVQNEVLNRLDLELDKYAYEKNKAQLDRLMGVSEEMSSRGLNPSMRLTIAEMRRYLRRELDPLISAYKERENLIKELRAKGDNYIFDKRYSETPLKDMLTGTNTYSAYNLDDALKEGMMSGKAISSRIYGNPQLSRELKNQYFKMTQGIPLDGRTVDQLFNDYRELQDDFTNWYGSNFSDSGFTEEDLNRAKQRYMSGVLRGIVYNESYLTNLGYESPAAKRAERRAIWQQEWQKQQTYGAEDANGNRIKDIGNGIVQVTPKADNVIGLGVPYFLDKDGNQITRELAQFELAKGIFKGYDKDGNPQYDTGNSIQTYDKNDPTKRIRTETYTQAGKESSNPDIDIDGSGTIKTSADVGDFVMFNFDSHYNNNNYKYEGSGDHYRGSVEEAVLHGYKVVPIDNLSNEIVEGIRSQLRSYKGSKLQISDIVVLEELPHHSTRPGRGESGDNHYMVTLKPGVYEKIYAGKQSPLRVLGEYQQKDIQQPGGGEIPPSQVLDTLVGNRNRYK